MGNAVQSTGHNTIRSTIRRTVRSTVTRGIMGLARFNRWRMDSAGKPNPFLTGLNTPMTAELSLHDLPVTGSIPPELDGRYLRIGPNPIGKAHGPSHHWFLGDGMVHGLRVKGGQALWYKNRWVRSSAVSRALGEERAPGPRHFGDNANTHVIGHAGKTWALVEAGPYPVELSDDLQTVAHNPFEGTLKGSFSAHSHLDPATGCLHAICYEGRDQTTIRHVVVAPNGQVVREEPIAVCHGPSVHDCMITANFVIVLDLPVTFSVSTLIAGYGFPYKWNPAHQARVGVLRKDAPGSSIVWCDVAPCYVFHPCNAFETPDGNITLDVVAHASMFADSKIGPNSQDSAFERWTVQPPTQTVQRRVIDAHPQEFPRMDERRQGQPYRYAYTMALKRDDDQQFVSGQCLIKHDLQQGTRSLHDFGPACYPGEFVFVPKTTTAMTTAMTMTTSAEDEGWLMGFVVNTDRNTTDWVILDAANFDGPPQARVTLPHRIPAGFHGSWVAG